MEFSFLFINFDKASAQNSCSPVTQSNYNACCGTVAAQSVNAIDCKAYLNGYSATPPVNPPVGTVGGGGPTSSCSPVTQSNYNVCCGVGANGANAIDCKAYLNGYSALPTYTPGGGVPVNNNNPTPPIIAPTPKSNSSSLSGCSAIRFDSVLDILVWIKCIIGAIIIPFIFTLAFLFFLVNMLKFMKGSSDAKKKEELKKLVFISIIALVIMVSIWAIVRIFTTTFGFGNTIPELQTDYLKTSGKK